MSTPILIISTGRTGTQFIANLFSQNYPQVAAYHITPYSTLINIVCNAYIDGFVPRQLVIKTWKFFKSTELNQCAKPIFLDSNNHLFALAAIAPELYPKLKVVHIVRDPRTYVRSHINWARHRRKSFIANFLIPFWQPNGFFCKEIPFYQWLTFSTIQRFSWIWKFKNQLMEQVATHNVPYLRIRFEDIFQSASPEQNLSKLVEFVGCPPRQNLVESLKKRANFTRVKSVPAWQHWTKEQCMQLHALCGKKMLQYGYGAEPEWQEKLVEVNNN